MAHQPYRQSPCAGAAAEEHFRICHTNRLHKRQGKIDSRTNLDLEQVMKNLKDELSQIKTAQESDKFSGSWIDIDNDAISTLEELIRKNKGIKNLSEMNTNDLKQLNDALTGVKRGVTQINKLIANHRFESVAKCAESTMETLKKKKSDLKSLGKVKKRC